MTGLFVSPGVGAAQEAPVDVDLIPLEASLTPAQATAGETVTVESVDPCSVHELVLDWGVFEAGTYSWDDAGNDAVPVAAGVQNSLGSSVWTVSFPAPAPGGPAEGEPFLSAGKLRAVAERPQWATSPRSLEVYGPLALEVDGTAYEWFGYCYDAVELYRLEAEITSHGPHPDYGFPIVDPADPAVVVNPIEPCSPASESLSWQVESLPLEEGQVGEIVVSGRFAIDGDWQLSFPPPVADVPAAYVVWATCLREFGMAGPGYYPLVFGVDAPAGPELPTEPPVQPSAPLPRPAQPVVTDPGYTG